jgi:hypothetical protein
MAEWLAFSVLERLRIDSLERRRASAQAGIRGSAALATARLDLESLGSPAGFVARHQRDGALTTYQLAFLMTDHLIEREGLGRLIDYFREFATSRDRHRNFERMFGQTLGAFEAEVLTDLERRARP